MVKRYDTDRDGEEYESETGPFVHFTDYAALAAELAECAAVRDSWCAEYVKARDASQAEVKQLTEELAAEKDNSRRGWELFQTFRKKYAEIRFPGMTNEVHTASLEQRAAAAEAQLKRAAEIIKTLIPEQLELACDECDGTDDDCTIANGGGFCEWRKSIKDARAFLASVGGGK